MCYTRRKIEGVLVHCGSLMIAHFLKPNGQSRKLNVYEITLTYLDEMSEYSVSSGVYSEEGAELRRA